MSIRLEDQTPCRICKANAHTITATIGGHEKGPVTTEKSDGAGVTPSRAGWRGSSLAHLTAVLVVLPGYCRQYVWQHRVIVRRAGCGDSLRKSRWGMNQLYFRNQGRKFHAYSVIALPELKGGNA
jgi:hypothetical protein